MLADVADGRTATTREFGTLPVQRFPPYAPTNNSEPSMLLAIETWPLVPTDWKVQEAPKSAEVLTPD
jgi:hypothetical protein